MGLKSSPRMRVARWTPSLLKLPVLSIRQPYAWLVVNGIKDIENRSWRTHHRGPILIHASQSTAELYLEVFEDLKKRTGVAAPDIDYPTGGIVGVAEIVDCVRTHKSVWKHRGQWGWVLANARPLPFRECKGAVGFFYPRW